MGAMLSGLGAWALLLFGLWLLVRTLRRLRVGLDQVRQAVAALPEVEPDTARDLLRPAALPSRRH